MQTKSIAKIIDLLISKTVLIMKQKLQMQLVSLEKMTRKLKSSLILVLLSVLFASVQSYGQSCPLACDDEVNVSLDANCSATITPDMLLEEVGTGCAYTVVVFGTNGLPLPSPVVNGTHIGKKLVVAVYLGNNSCWGHIVVEDKFRPEYTCPQPDTIFCTNRNYIPKPGSISDNCTPANQLVKHVLYDSMVMYTDCMRPERNNLIGYRKIACYYTDISGNHSDTCAQYIYFKKFLEADITWPRDTVYTCKQYNDSIPQPEQSGVPTVNGDPLFPSWGVCKAAVTFEDQIIPQCPKSYKVLRTWTVIDWCMPSGQNVYKKYQVIKVIDDRGPIMICSPRMEISTDVSSCSGTAIIAPPTIIDECSKVTFQVGYKVLSPNGSATYEGTSSANVTKLSSGLYRITELPLGLSWVVFRGTDECGNFTDCATEVLVVDKVPPIPVCDQKTIVSLTVDGTARIDAFTFDDGSLDNCGINSYEVKRMDNGAPCKTPNGSLFGPSVYFCCADIGKTIMVSLRVWDNSGNSNTCMVEVAVQDKIPPVIVCPPNITVSCEFAYADLNAFGKVVTNITDRKKIEINDAHKVINGEPLDGYAYDGCGVTVNEIIRNETKCGVGNIYRTFTATDGNGLTQNCTQTITIQDFTPNNISIIWPPDYVSSTNCMKKPDIDPSVTKEPVVLGQDKCTNIYKNYEDKVYTLDPDACVKIIRTWTIIDWCVYDPNATNPRGYYTWKQVLKITNTQAPTFNIPCFDRFVDVFGPGCGGNVDLVGRATDDCTDSADLVWYRTVDINNDGTIDTAFSGPGPNATKWYPVGTHKVTFSVKDACGNENKCTFLLTVRDAKKPTPYCISSITTTVMPSSKNIEIWAKDFNLNSEDNCTPKDKLRYFFFVNNTFVPSMVFDCGNIGKNTIRVYVMDEFGNYDYCETVMEIQDPNQVCKGTGLTIQGKISNARNETMENVSVFLERTNPTGSAISYTNNSGIYSFNTIVANTDYTIGVEKNHDPLNGVTTADIVAIQRHILGKAILNSPYKLIAADANNSSGITSADISEVRKLLLGVVSEFPKNKSWRFVPKAFTFNDPTSPFPFNERIVYSAINRDQMNSDFVGVKIGDVTEDSDPNSAKSISQGRTKGSFKMIAEEAVVTAENKQKIAVKAGSTINLSGLQVALSVTEGQIKGIEGAKLLIGNDEVSVKNGIASVVYAPTETILVEEGDVLFYVEIEKENRTNQQGTLTIADYRLRAEAYDNDIEAIKIELEARTKEVVQDKKKPTLLQNSPNPFSEQTTVGFSVPVKEKVNLEVFDMNGRTVYSLSGTYEAGSHEVVIKRGKLGNEGIYILRMSTKDFSATKKMVYIK